MIRIVKKGIVVYESEKLYDIADWLYHEAEEVKMMEVRTNMEEYDKAQAAKR